MNPLWLFWGQETMSFLRYATLATACAVHDDVRLVIRRQALRSPAIHGTVKQEYHLGVPGADWMEAALKLPLAVYELSEVAAEIADMGASDSHTKDLLMYRLMATIGGSFADMDIVFLKGLPAVAHDVQIPVIQSSRIVDLRTQRERRANEAQVRCSVMPRLRSAIPREDLGKVLPGRSMSYIPVGFVQGRPCEAWDKAMAKAVSNYDPDDYQCGVFCLDQTTDGTLPATIVYPWANESVTKQISYCFGESWWPEIPSDSIGVHWYAGGAQRWNAQIGSIGELPAGAVGWAIKEMAERCRDFAPVS